MSDPTSTPLPTGPRAPPVVGMRMCADCSYWLRGQDADGTLWDYGQCRRNTPSFGPPLEHPLPPEDTRKLFLAVWPWSGIGDWCGEYKLG